MPSGPSSSPSSVPIWATQALNARPVQAGVRCPRDCWARSSGLGNNQRSRAGGTGSRMRRRCQVVITSAVSVVIGSRRRIRLPVPPALDRWLFPSPLLRAQQSRGHLTPACTGRAFKAWVAQIGTLAGELLGPDGIPAPFDRALVTPYALRHSYAQRHADAGVPVDVLKELMDHVAVATTMGYYSVGLKRKQQAIRSVGSVEAAAGALEADRAGATTGLDVGRFGAVAERHR